RSIQSLGVSPNIVVEQPRRSPSTEEEDEPASAVGQRSEADLRGVGLSRQKAQYFTNVARFTLREKLRSLDWSTYSDAGIMDFLGQIKGVGPWTVQMILLFSLGRPDVFPVKDLIIAQSMVKLYGVEAQGRAQLARLEAIAEAWRPYRSTACRYLWRWHDQKKET
ncbi:MAG: DNA-3-methyladenine glycosylase 2 family protein, partial [Bacteroidota bacterium]